MDLNTSIPSPSTAFPTEGSAFEAPIPHGASPSLAALVGREESQSDAEQDCPSVVLSGHRLGVASSLFRAMRLRHPPTAKHCLRVALGCSVFSSVLNLDARTREQIEIAALLHDVGKLGVPDSILNKPGPLNAAEYEAMQPHLEYAVHMLEPFCDDQGILDIVRLSGNWFDGSRPVGSPICGDDIPLGARILAILNAFDAMTSDFVYRRALPREQAISELFANSPTQFDSRLVSAFCDANRNSTAQFQADVVRRWVELSSESVDSLWSFASPIGSMGADIQSMFQQRLLASMHDGVVFVDVAGRVMVWNRGAEELTGLSKGSVHHRQWQPQMVDLRDVEGNAIKVKSCPLLSCLASFEESMHRMTLTNSIRNERVAINVHVMPVTDVGGACHGAIVNLHDVSPEQSLEERVQNLHTKATSDALTGVGNRAEFDRRLNELVAHHSTCDEPLGLVICDIDKFKSINDTYGHQAGDAALIEFASLIDQLSRNNDIVARYGGEEFVLLCPGCDGDLAQKKAEQVRRELAATPQAALRNTKMTASFGVTQMRPGDTPESMLKRADECLYEAKQTGRNRVVLDTVADESAPTDKKASWFSWASGKTQDSELLRRELKCSVPVNVVTEKFRGFVSDNNAEVVSASDSTVKVLIDGRNFPTMRRHSDRPFVLVLGVELSDNASDGGTIIQVTVSTRSGRERRQDDAVERSEQLVQSLKAYLIAEEC